MKLSELRARLGALGRRVDRLAQGVAADTFDREVDALRAALQDLQAWTKPRGGGSFEVDLEPYASAGGAPAFMRDHAALLLGAATMLRNAERGRAAASSGSDRAAPGPSQRPDLVTPLAAPLDYSSADVARIQRVFRYLYTRRAYRKLSGGEVLVRSIDEGYLPESVRTIAQLSRHNLSALRRMLAPLSDDERRLYDMLRGLPFTLKHATTASGWASICNAGLIFSKDALTDWNLIVPTHTPPSDERYKQDVDFAFFRVEVGDADWISRFGAVAGQMRVVFDWNQVLQDGWISLHDMLAPLGSTDPRVELRTRDGDELLRISEPDMELEGTGKKWIHWKWKHRFVADGRERRVHILDEVFQGPDILEGIVLAALRELRELPPLQREALRHLQDPNYAHWLIKSLFRIEAKAPSPFRFEPDEVRRTYGDPRSTRATLGAATERTGPAP